MSRELMSALFERDLDSQEMDAIAAALRSSPDEAAHFAALAAAHYQSLGLKPPRPPRPAAWKLWGSLGLGLLAVGLWQAWPDPMPPVEATSASQTAALEPAATRAPMAPAPQPTRFAEGEQMRVEVHLPRAMPVQVDLFNAQNRRLRRLYEGESPAGLNSYLFDGKDQQGKPLAPGRYRVVVDYGGGVMEKVFETR